MKALLSGICVLALAQFGWATSTIDSATTNRFSHSANGGWVDWKGNTNNGAVIGEYVCSGYIYSANVGWINLGNGAPANQVQYQNNNNDFGVNTDTAGNLRGFAYGANIGWVAFESNGAPRVNLLTGKLSGYAYSANCGWISLSNASACVKTTSIPQGVDGNGNGLPDAWEQLVFGYIGVNPDADPDGDGVSNLAEYLAGTNPLDGTDRLRITSYTHSSPALNNLSWTSKSNRAYAVQYRPEFVAAYPWSDLYVFPTLGASNLSFDFGGGTNYFQVRAFRPLTP